MITPPSYPMRPLNGGHLESKFTITPPWPKAYEPKANGWRLTVHAPTGTCFNRYNEVSTITDEFQEALAILRESPFIWLDCEALSRRHKIGRGSLIVLDIMDDGDLHEYSTRRANLEKHFSMLGWRSAIPSLQAHPNSVWCLPSMVGSWPRAEWEALQKANRDNGLTGENVMWEGLVCKRLDSLYTLQLQDSKRETTNWIKHRFI